MTSQRASTAGLDERLPTAQASASVLFAQSATYTPAGPRAEKLEQLRLICVAIAQYVLAIALSVTSQFRDLNVALASSSSSTPCYSVAIPGGATWGTVGYRAPSSFHWYDVVSGEKQRDIALLAD